MKLHYKPLSEHDFTLLVRWLNEPHVQQWWPTTQTITIEDVYSKYGPRIDGRERVNCYIVYSEKIPFGFIQVYDARLFAREGYNLDQFTELSFIKRLAAIDFFIGERSYLSKGCGALMIQQCIEQIVSSQYDACIADPAGKNVASIKSLEKIGFVKLSEVLLPEGHSTWLMILSMV